MAIKNNKSLGQHWLKDRFLLDLIADYAKGSANISPSDHKLGRSPLGTRTAALSASEGDGVCAPPTTCLEIGPGLGTLTSALLRQFEHVIAVEYDERLAHNLPNSFPGKNLTVVNQDFLTFDLNTVPAPYVVAGNIPYYITSPIIQLLLAAENRPARIVLLIQKEVAQRIAAEPGEHTYLSLLVQNRAAVTLGPVVERELFAPPPKVDSQIIILDPLPQPQVSDDVMKLVKIGFSAPRKKLVANLAAGLHREKREISEIFTAHGLDPDCRPAALALEDWPRLHTALQ